MLLLYTALSSQGLLVLSGKYRCHGSLFILLPQDSYFVQVLPLSHSKWAWLPAFLRRGSIKPFPSHVLTSCYIPVDTPLLGVHDRNKVCLLTLSSGHTACLQGPAKATVPVSLFFNVLFPFLHKHALIYLNWHSNLCPIKSQKITRKCYLWIPSSSSSILHSGLPVGMYCNTLYHTGRCELASAH